MKKSKSFLIIIVFFLFSIVYVYTNQELMPFAVKGDLDLSNWDFSENGIVNLNGEWDFVPFEFVKPVEFMKSDRQNGNYQYVPGLWGNPFKPEKSNPWKGYYTFHLKVKVNKPGKILFLKIDQFNTSYKIWIDRELIIKNGEVGKNKKQCRPKLRPIKKAFKVDSDEFHITIHCSNYDDKFGTLTENVLLGYEKDIDNSIFLYTTIELTAVTILGIGFIVLLVLCFLVKDTCLICLPGLCISSILKIIFEGERIILTFLPNIPINIIYKFIYGSYYTIVLFLFLFYALMCKDYILPIFIKLFVFIYFIFMIIVIGGDIELITTSTIVFNIMPASTGVLLIFISFQTFKLKKWFTIYFFIGTILIFAFTFNDIFVLYGIKAVRYFKPIVFVFFVLFNTVSFVIYKKKNTKTDNNTKDDIDIIFNKLKLSIREKEVAVLLIKGHTNAQIADELFISISTTKFHIYNIYKKAEVKKRSQFLNLFFRLLVNNKVIKNKNILIA